MSIDKVNYGDTHCLVFRAHSLSWGLFEPHMAWYNVMNKNRLTKMADIGIISEENTPSTDTSPYLQLFYAVPLKLGHPVYIRVKRLCMHTLLNVQASWDC